MPRRRVARHVVLVVPMALLLAGAAPGAAPAPKAATAEAADPGVAVLRSFAGVWNATMQIASPDDSPALVLSGIEVNTLGEGGAWVTSDFHSQVGDRPFQGHAILSWNRASGRFRRVWADASSPVFWLSEGTWDAATRTLTLWVETVNSSGAPVRWHEETVFKDDDTRTFTMYVPGSRPTDAAAISIIYRRRKEGAPRPPFVPLPAPPSPGHALVLRDAGAWGAQMLDRPLPGGGSSSAKGTETSTVCCGGNFLVSDYRADSKKAPFAGHGLLGYDPERKKYLSAWVDTAGAILEVREGDYDAAADTLTFNLEAAGGSGRTTPAREVLQWKGADQRTRTILTSEADGREKTGMTIKYRRARASGPTGGR